MLEDTELKYVGKEMVDLWAKNGLNLWIKNGLNLWIKNGLNLGLKTGFMKEKTTAGFGIKPSYVFNTRQKHHGRQTLCVHVSVCVTELHINILFLCLVQL